jgi:Protein of unknown function (DUF998)
MRADSLAQVTSRAWIAVAGCGLAAFAVIVATQGLLPGASFDPAHQTISEYAHTSGALMVVGFLAWALSWAVLAGPGAAPSPSSSSPRLLVLQRIAFAGTAVGLVLVACFATDRGLVEPGVVLQATTEGRIHDAASALVMAGILVGALLGAALIGGRVRALSLLLISTAIVADVLLLILGDPVPGIRQRILATAGCLWQALWLAALWPVRALESP